LQGRTPAFQIHRIIPTADPRGLDPASIFLTGAAALALADAGIEIRGKLRDRAGLVVGTTHLSPKSGKDFKRSIEDRGLARLSTKAFARIVLNASAGTCSKILSLKGPNTTITTGQGSGLSAIICAAEMLSERDDSDLIVAGGVDELPEPGKGGASTGSFDPALPGLCDGAACVVLYSGPNMPATSIQTAIRLAGWGVAGPGLLNDAVDKALSVAGMTREDIQLVYGCGEELDSMLLKAGKLPGNIPPIDPTRVLGTAEASSAALACVAGVIALREHRARVVLVVEGASKSAVCALLLTTRGA
jgi:hypothetical protein